MPLPPVGHLLEHGDVVDELEGSEQAVEAWLLRQVAEPAAHREPAGSGARVLPAQLEPSLVGREHRGEDAQQRRLTGAVRAEQTGDASRGREGDSVEHARASVGLDDPVGDDGHADLPRVVKLLRRTATTTAPARAATRQVIWAPARKASSGSLPAANPDSTALNQAALNPQAAQTMST